VLFREPHDDCGHHLELLLFFFLFFSLAASRPEKHSKINMMEERRFLAEVIPDFCSETLPSTIIDILDSSNDFIAVLPSHTLNPKDEFNEESA